MQTASPAAISIDKTELAKVSIFKYPVSHIAAGSVTVAKAECRSKAERTEDEVRLNLRSRSITH